MFKHIKDNSVVRHLEKRLIDAVVASQGLVCRSGRKAIGNLGCGEVYRRDCEALYWKKFKLIITQKGSWTLISPRDQKRLLLLEKSYSKFLGTRRF